MVVWMDHDVFYLSSISSGSLGWGDVDLVG